MVRLTIIRAERAPRIASLALAIGLAAASLLADARAGSPVDREQRETPVVRAVRRVSASVVNIHGQKTVRGTAAGFAGASSETMRQVNGMGTGIVIDPRGYLITNYHVVEDVSDIRVTLADKRSATAEQIAHDARYDLAVLKISMDEPLPVVPLGTSEDLMVGERVIAIGNAFGYENTVTDGIISALHRDVPVNDQQEYRDLIQTSAGINPGNSGGPLLNIQGEVIGINVAVRVGAQSIAFAIPIDQAIQVSRNLIREYNDQHVTLGLAGTVDGTSSAGGLLITSLTEGGPGSAGGLRTGDRIVQIGDRTIDDALDFELAILGIAPGQRVGVNVQRGGQETAVELQASEPSQPADSRGVAARIWSMVGIQAEPLSVAAVRQLNGRLRIEKPYKGGLRITAVRPGSPADRQMIRGGDVLLGIHGWQTASIDDLDLILRSPEMKTSPQAEFYIVRRDQTLVGHLRLAQSDPVHAAR